MKKEQEERRVNQGEPQSVGQKVWVQTEGALKLQDM